ncbi:MAG TPA: hypothetical protein VFE82_14135 [Ramlibacter sp.]|jgi:hypothetical protein|uniref:hypothetical protein n=1 Tax=Ramlibacter sp. TaxID=1917967 RepID=UPI002D3596F9|nr:hypothetical protein [Ramlibacter sp.]HZY19611.1 hypothetical protein [Ramlibacter sp.]
MAVNSTYLGAAKVTGQEAEAFARKITHGRGNKAASAAAKNGRHMTTVFARKGVATFTLKKSTSAK